MLSKITLAYKAFTIFGENRYYFASPLCQQNTLDNFLTYFKKLDYIENPEGFAIVLSKKPPYKTLDSLHNIIGNDNFISLLLFDRQHRLVLSKILTKKEYDTEYSNKVIHIL